jgi:hypothetical protein
MLRAPAKWRAIVATHSGTFEFGCRWDNGIRGEKLEGNMQLHEASTEKRASRPRQADIRQPSASLRH